MVSLLGRPGRLNMYTHDPPKPHTGPETLNPFSEGWRDLMVWWIVGVSWDSVWLRGVMSIHIKSASSPGCVGFLRPRVAG